MKQSAEWMSYCSETSTFLLSDVQQYPTLPVLLCFLSRCGIERRLQRIYTGIAEQLSVSETRIQSFDVSFIWLDNKVIGAVQVRGFKK